MKRQHHQVLIIGAGFAGITLAKALKNAPFDVLLVDKNNYHTFQPLLYQVATGGLEADSIAYPVRRIFRGYRNVRFQMAEVLRLNLPAKKAETTAGTLSYEYLVIATGSTNNFFNFEPIKEDLLTLKSVPDALDFRSFLMQNLEKAIATYDPGARDELMNIGIIGGGPAGIELAGAIAEMKHYVLPKDFPQIDFKTMSIHLFEAGNELLGNMSDKSSKFSLKYLQNLGVQVHLNSKVKSYTNQRIQLEDGTELATDNVIWTAGVKGNPIPGLPPELIVGGNRITVNAFNQIPGYEYAFVLGDVASHVDDANPKGLPMLAQVGIQQARHLAKNLKRLIRQQPLEPFAYYNKGVMATIGRNRAVVDLPHWKFKGPFAWFVWMFVHIMSLVGFRNKLVTFIDWMGNYFNYDRPLGLIIRPYKKKQKIPADPVT
ncbi:MAG: NAD(P)/FAD-dependent oxidoreductase [Saprospiraceae bacterium]|nr:NAD(P)/FAD-dependent oxidoreductase [Saprospiraceae bacterium]MCB9321628.1 NAD(P)/FAD-dependent oxidoreductase [Lewinellaceae bacterium]